MVLIAWEAQITNQCVVVQKVIIYKNLIDFNFYNILNKKIGFGGPPCTKIYQCYPTTCLNGGTCVSGKDNTYSCQCLPG